MLQSFQRSLQRYLNDKNSKLNILKDQEFLKSREVLLSKKKQLVFEEVKGNRPQLQKNYPTPKKICCLIPVNLMLKTLKPSNTQFAPVKKKKAQSPRSPRKEELSSAMILILILISWLNLIRCLRKILSFGSFNFFHWRLHHCRVI